MNNIKKLDLKVKKPNTCGVFHDTRGDVAIILKCINLMSKKIDELVDNNNSLVKENYKLKAEINAVKAFR